MGSLRTAMRTSKKHAKPPNLQLQTARDPSPSCSIVVSDCEADDEGSMSAGDESSRPLSLAIPPLPYYPSRPTLQEILANEAPPPWSLSAFTAYLSQNHCLETLEFTSDARRYVKQYQDTADPQGTITTARDSDYLRMLWQRLLQAYIAPNASREVNIPSAVRNRLLALDYTTTPPDPRELDDAVRIVFDLMDESVLVSFLESIPPRDADGASILELTSSQLLVACGNRCSDEDRSTSPGRTTRMTDRSPPLSANAPDLAKSHSAASRMSQLSAGFVRVSRLSQHLSSSSSSETPESLASDTDSTSPPGSALDPATPPHSPPRSDLSPDKEAAWKKMSSKLGFKKGRSFHVSSPSTSSGRFRFKDGSDDLRSP